MMERKAAFFERPAIEVPAIRSVEVVTAETASGSYDATTGVLSVRVPVAASVVQLETGLALKEDKANKNANGGYVGRNSNGGAQVTYAKVDYLLMPADGNYYRVKLIKNGDVIEWDISQTPEP